MATPPDAPLPESGVAGWLWQAPPQAELGAEPLPALRLSSAQIQFPGIPGVYGFRGSEGYFNSLPSATQVSSGRWFAPNSMREWVSILSSQAQRGVVP